MLVLVALAVGYIFYFTGWFQPKIIHITSTNARNARVIRAGADATTVPVIFKLGRPCKPTEIKVVLLAAWQTNQNTMPVWHLVADTNVEPVKIFFYGQRIRGLKPEVSGARAEPLQPDVTYRLFVTAGSAKGQHDFEAKAAN